MRRCTPRSRRARTLTASIPPVTSRLPARPPRRATRRNPKKTRRSRASRDDAAGLLILDDVLHALEEIKLVQRLHDVVVRAELAPARRVALAAEARHHHHRQRLGALL